MLNVLLFIMYFGIFVISVTMLHNRVAASVAALCLGVGIALICITTIIPVVKKKRKLSEILLPDLAKAKRLWFFQIIKVAIVGICITQFIRVDMADVNQTYVYSIETVAIMSNTDDAAELCDYLIATKTVTPLCIKEYIIKMCDEVISEHSTNAFIETMSERDVEGIDADAMIEYAIDRHEAVKEETKAASKNIYQFSGYILIYLIVDLGREIRINNIDKRKNNDDEKKKDIFSGVNLMGD